MTIPKIDPASEGAIRVRISHNHSGDEVVDEVKALAADLINSLVYAGVRDKVNRLQTYLLDCRSAHLSNTEGTRCINKAIGYINALDERLGTAKGLLDMVEESAMWAVKGVTAK